jgi:hypothetical protein
MALVINMSPNEFVGCVAESRPETIVAAAAMVHGKLYTDYDHHSAFYQAVDDGTADENDFLTDIHQEGFLTSTGRFVSREEALQIARAARQFNRDTSAARQGWLDAGELFDGY